MVRTICKKYSVSKWIFCQLIIIFFVLCSMINLYAFHNAQCAKPNPISSFLKLNPFSFKMAHRNQFQCRFEKWQLLQSQQIIENWSKLSRCPKTQETKPHPRLVPTKRRQQLIFRFLAEPPSTMHKKWSDQHHGGAIGN